MHSIRSLCFATAGLVLLNINGQSGIPAHADEPAAGVTAAEDGSGELRPHIVISTIQPPATAAGIAASPFGLTRKDFEIIRATVPTLQWAVPVREIQRRVQVGDRTADVRLIGTSHDYARMHELKLERGRFLIDADLDQLRNVAVLGDQIAHRLFPTEDPIGKNVRIDRQYFLVVGTIESRVRGENAAAEAGLDLYIPLSTMRSRLGDREVVRRAGNISIENFELSRIEIQVTQFTDLEMTAKLVDALLRRRHEEGTFKVTNSIENLVRRRP